MLVSTRIRTRGLPEREKSENLLSKALPLSHGGITLDGDKSTKEFPISKMLLLNIGQELTYHYNGCQNARNCYILYNPGQLRYIYHEFVPVKDFC